MPGITAAFAAAAAIPCSLTDRNSASNVIFSTGHHAQSHNDSPLPQLEDATRVVYMPGRDLRLLAAEWLAGRTAARSSLAQSSPAPRNLTSRSYHTTLAELGDCPPAASSQAFSSPDGPCGTRLSPLAPAQEALEATA